jgi:GNAT superfamily N-acetyltransferase
MPLRDDSDGDAALETRIVPADRPPASDLIAAMVAEVAALYGTIERVGAPTATPDELSVPHGGAYVLLCEDGRPVAGGGVKRLGDGLGEIKRMYVVPHARGRGLSRALLSALEHTARSLGYARVRLDTGADQPAARALYLSAGYRQIDDYNGNPWAAFWGEKALC